MVFLCRVLRGVILIPCLPCRSLPVPRSYSGIRDESWREGCYWDAYSTQTVRPTRHFTDRHRVGLFLFPIQSALNGNSLISEDVRIMAGWKSVNAKEMSTSCHPKQTAPPERTDRTRVSLARSLSTLKCSTLYFIITLLLLLPQRRPSTLATYVDYFPSNGPVAISSGWNIAWNCSSGISRCVAWRPFFREKEKKKKNKRLRDDQTPLVSFSGNVLSFLCDSYLFTNHYVKEIIYRIYSDSVFAFVCFFFFFCILSSECLILMLNLNYKATFPKQFFLLFFFSFLFLGGVGGVWWIYDELAMYVCF